MKKASLTPFCALCLMLIATFLFALLELVRVYGLDYYASLKAEAGMDSVCAEFQPLLWKQYGLLVLDGAYGTEYFSDEYITERLTEMISMQTTKKESFFNQKKLDLFRIFLSEVEMKGFALLTDEEGDLFLKLVAERMKESLPLGIAEDIYEKYQKNNLLGNGALEDAVREAKETLHWAKSSKWDEIDEKIEAAETEEEEELARAEAWVFNSSRLNTLDDVFSNASRLQSSGILNMVFTDVSGISAKTSELEMRMETRLKKEGNMHYTAEVDWYQKILVLEYLDNYFSCYEETKADHFLEYEMEYVLAGKNTEWRNLEVTLQKLLLVREAANFSYLLKDAGKMQQAEEMAKAIGLLVGENPAIVKVIQLGIIAAWAYGESVLDVRALVAGEVIPLMKDTMEWTLDITNLFTVFQLNTQAKQCESGMNYKEYLKLLLFMEKNETLAFRMMEAMEMSLQATSDYKNCRMDQMLVAMQYQFHFESSPLFSSLTTIGDSYGGNYHFIKKELRSYVP